VVGAFNAGAVGYVALTYEDVRVVNFDGLVNNRVYEAVVAGRYLEYVLATVDILFEPPDRASMFLPPSELEQLKASYEKSADGMWHRS